ncbi:MAG: SRPBCC domain-containing protein [Gemmatimonadota bacterium]|nr:SRPBCC domain-containing protein [Gemmatimonadota bacterium]
MRFDVEAQLNAAARCVSSLERDGESVHAVTIDRSYSTTAEDLWDAVTNGQRISRWFLPISGDLKLDGRYQLEGNAGGVITACRRPSQFEATWEFDGDVSWVELDISEDGNGDPRLSLTHTARHSPHWDEFGPGAAGVGWEMGLLGLFFHIENRTEPKLDEAAFAVSPEGKAYIAGSSRGWEMAAVAAGTDPIAARAAAVRTAAFYTGESA